MRSEVTLRDDAAEIPSYEEENKVCEKPFGAINYVLDQGGAMMRGGTIVDATIISAPSSTKNKSKERDSEMRQTRKGNEWHFGMKCHIGVDAGSGYVHTIEATAANVSDIAMAHKLFREDDEVGYVGLEKREEIRTDTHLAGIEYQLTTVPEACATWKSA